MTTQALIARHLFMASVYADAITEAPTVEDGQRMKDLTAAHVVATASLAREWGLVTETTEEAVQAVYAVVEELRSYPTRGGYRITQAAQEAKHIAPRTPSRKDFFMADSPEVAWDADTVEGTQ